MFARVVEFVPGVGRGENDFAVESKFGSVKLEPTRRGALTLASLLAVLLIASGPLQAQKETILYSFGGYSGDGTRPAGGVVADRKGNLYGTTLFGGAYDGACHYGRGECGTVFEVSTAGVETVLYNFRGYYSSGDGENPSGSLLLDRSGNLYGTTRGGGTAGCGTVFKLTPTGAETILHNFEIPSWYDGCDPYDGVIMDKAGNLYGVAPNTLFEMTGMAFEVSNANAYPERILYLFGANGWYPIGKLVFDEQGNLYGATYYGGIDCCYGYGMVFKLTPTGDETDLYDFGAEDGDGQNPSGSLLRDQAGNLYGTTIGGGAYGYGTVFKLTPAGDETVLYSFGGGIGDGFDPGDGLIVDRKGNFYGTTYEGGVYGGGIVFKLTPSGHLRVLYSFGGQSGDGRSPNGDLIMDQKGILYGTTNEGGAYGMGTVFKLTR